MHQPVSECGMDLVVECGAGEGRGTDVVQTISPAVSDLPKNASITFIKQQQYLHNPII